MKSQTREQVRKAAERLGYQSGTVDDESRNDRIGTGNIAVFLTGLGNFYFTDVLKGLLSVAQASGYRVFVADIDSRARSHLRILSGTTRRFLKHELYERRDG